MKKLGDPIYFSDFRFHAGVNMTIRRGVEWDLAPKGVYLARHPWENQNSFPIKITETRVICFKDIPEAWLQLQHNLGPAVATKDLLKQELQLIYSHFYEIEIVTCVFFMPMPKEETANARSRKRGPYHRDQEAAPEKTEVEKAKT